MKYIEIVYFVYDTELFSNYVNKNLSDKFRFENSLPYGVGGMEYVGVKVKDYNMYGCKIPADAYIPLFSRIPDGVSVLATGYPEDDIQMMLYHNKIYFVKEIVNSEGKVVEVKDDPGVRIPPTLDACKQYRSMLPEPMTAIDENGKNVVFDEGRFFNFGSIGL